MDPSIMKLLEDDEDETMHSGADIEAFTAALNRDIEGTASASQPSDSDSAALSQGSNHTSSQLFPQWQISGHGENTSFQGEQEPKGSQKYERHLSVTKPKLPGSLSETSGPQNSTFQELSHHLPLVQQQQQASHNSFHMSQNVGVQKSEKTHSQLQKLPEIARNQESEAAQFQRSQRIGNQEAVTAGQAVNTMNRGKQVPFALLLPVIQPQLEKDRAMQLNALYIQLKQNKITKEEFVRHMRSLVGDHMLKMAVFKLQGQGARNSQTAPSQLPLLAQASAKHIQKPFSSSSPLSSAAEQSADSSSLRMESVAQTFSHGSQINQTTSSNMSSGNQEMEHPFPMQALSKQQQQHLHFPQSPFPAYGSTGSNYSPYSTASISNSAQHFMQQSHDLQIRQVPIHPGISTTQAGMATQALNSVSVPKSERQDSHNEFNKAQSGLSHLTNNSTLQKNSGNRQPSFHKDKNQIASVNYVQQEPTDKAEAQQHKSLLSTPQALSSFGEGQLEPGSAAVGTSKDESFEIPSSRKSFSASMSTLPANSERRTITSQLERQNVHLSSQIPSVTSSLGPGSSNVKAPPKKASVGLKKPVETTGFSLTPSSKKQKVSGAFSDQSIEQLNDVTAVSGVNIREEEEQLFSASKEDSRVSEASRKVVQEEEERTILQKIPLQEKLTEIMAKCGLKGKSSDVERCLSLCVEERMRGLISNLIRLSKQRLDLEKSRHQVVFSSDVRQQIMLMNRKAREVWEKRQAESERLQRMDEPEGNAGVDGDKEKDETRGKLSKANKDDDDKMRTTAANVAARAAVGGDDMLSKWQLMAEQARQKREGVVDAPSVSLASVDVSPNPVTTSARHVRENPDAETRSSSAVIVAPGTSAKKLGRNRDTVLQVNVGRSVSVKDVVSVLEREPQMLKSALLYRLYEKVRSDASPE